MVQIVADQFVPLQWTQCFPPRNNTLDSGQWRPSPSHAIQIVPKPCFFFQNHHKLFHSL